MTEPLIPYDIGPYPVTEDRAGNLVAVTNRLRRPGARISPQPQPVCACHGMRVGHVHPDNFRRDPGGRDPERGWNWHCPAEDCSGYSVTLLVLEEWAKRATEDVGRAMWIESLRQRYGLVTADGGPPRQPCGMTADGNYEGWYMDERGYGSTPAVWRGRHQPDPLEGLTDFQKLGYWNEMSLRSQSLFAPDEGLERLRHQIAQQGARRPEWPVLPPDYAGAETVSVQEVAWEHPGYRGRVRTSGREYETEALHPPEWRP